MYYPVVLQNSKDILGGNMVELYGKYRIG